MKLVWIFQWKSIKRNIVSCNARCFSILNFEKVIFKDTSQIKKSLLFLQIILHWMTTTYQFFIVINEFLKVQKMEWIFGILQSNVSENYLQKNLPNERRCKWILFRRWLWGVRRTCRNPFRTWSRPGPGTWWSGPTFPWRCKTRSAERRHKRGVRHSCESAIKYFDL